MSIKWKHWTCFYVLPLHDSTWNSREDCKYLCWTQWWKTTAKGSFTWGDGWVQARLSGVPYQIITFITPGIQIIGTYTPGIQPTHTSSIVRDQIVITPGIQRGLSCTTTWARAWKRVSSLKLGKILLLWRRTTKRPQLDDLIPQFAAKRVRLPRYLRCWR